MNEQQKKTGFKGALAAMAVAMAALFGKGERTAQKVGSEFAEGAGCWSRAAKTVEETGRIPGTHPPTLRPLPRDLTPPEWKPGLSNLPPSWKPGTSLSPSSKLNTPGFKPLIEPPIASKEVRLSEALRASARAGRVEALAQSCRQSEQRLSALKLRVPAQVLRSLLDRRQHLQDRIDDAKTKGATDQQIDSLAREQAEVDAQIAGLEQQYG